ncbi:MAG: hypothetical protein U5O39_06910 [Gammaproteobacteria bacterium]|nr:hypothetical protein [Gammaproteobacteria bacterium]
MSKVIVDVEKLDVPEHLRTGDYEADPEFREKFQAWIAECWKKKDERLASYLELQIAPDDTPGIHTPNTSG